MSLKHLAVLKNFLPEAVISRTNLSPAINSAELLDFSPRGRTSYMSHVTEAIASRGFVLELALRVGLIDQKCLLPLGWCKRESQEVWEMRRAVGLEVELGTFKERLSTNAQLLNCII